MTTWQTLKPHLQAALVDAFNEAAFEQMLAYKCDKKLVHLTADKIPFPQKVFEVINATEREGWLDCLVRGAREANRDHAALQSVTDEVLAGIEVEGRGFYQLPHKFGSVLMGENGQEKASYLTQIYELLIAHFDEAELQTLCFYLGIDYESLVGTAKPGKARALVQYCDRAGRLGDLRAKVKGERPFVEWPEAPQSRQNQEAPGVAVDLDTWVETLKTCATMMNRERRDDVVRDLPSFCQGNIERRTALYDDVYNIAYTCMQYDDGMSALVAAIKKREGPSVCAQKLESFLQQ